MKLLRSADLGILQGENARLYAIIDRLNARGSDGGSEETASQLSEASGYGGVPTLGGGAREDARGDSASMVRDF